MKLNFNIYTVFSSVLGILAATLFSSGVTLVFLDMSYFVEWELFFLNSCSVVMGLYFDWMSMFFMSVVCFISCMIMIYSKYYMEGEKNLLRFILILLLFVGSMMALIISPNMISLLLGWDGLGLTSYCLVIFYQSESSCNAGMLTVLMNRVGDAAILMSIGLLFSEGSWSFSFYDKLSLNFILFLVILAAMTKSAQIPFSAWLPAAMAAPTPVSALVHSSTLVTAGVYLMIRFNTLLMSCGLNEALFIIAVMTMFMSGLSANFECDLKKVIALSTLSQLGLMMMVLSLGFYKLAFFHLLTHALFKSTLFMCAGFIIHNIKGSQDSRLVSSFSGSSPVLSLVFSTTNLALCGFPFLAGFYSKDIILESVFMSSVSFVYTSLIVLATGFTLSYSLRLIFMTFMETSNLNSVSSSMDMDTNMMKSTLGLFMASIFGGCFLSWLSFSQGSVILLNSMEKYMILFISLLFSVFMVYYLVGNKLSSMSSSLIFKFVKGTSSMWFMPFLSTNISSFLFLKQGFVLVKSLESGWLEFYGGQGGRNLFLLMSGKLQLGQKSIVVSSYFMTFILVFVFVLGTM